MTKDNSVGNDNPERKEFSQMPVDAKHRDLYPEWEDVGEPYLDGNRVMVMIRKRIVIE